VSDLQADLTATFTADGAAPFTVDAAFEVGAGESLVVLGPSGSGKTLLLETVAGFHDHDGVVTFDGREIHTAAPEHRGFGFVFQDYALFPHMTVTENVEYGTRYHDDTRDPAQLLAELDVADLADRYPPTLSGGERQRVALARALAIDPDVLLLDEPLAALDVPTRQQLRDDLAAVLADVTAVYVTHNRTTARALADRLLVMRDGTVVQRGTPETVFERPASPTVAEFTGANVIDLAAAPAVGTLLDDDHAHSGHVAVRPEAIVIGVPDAEADLQATVERVAREDAATRVTLAFESVTVDAFATDPPAVGETVGVVLPRDRLHRC
jgi:ABC-type Fe3+/spermidine/putrescine transport system ATPase subunit